MKPSEEILSLMERVARHEVTPRQATGAIARFAVQVFNAGVLGARASSDEPTGVSCPCAGDPRSPEDGPSVAAGKRAIDGQGGAIITHIFRRYPTDMSTRCGRSVLRAFPCVTGDFAAREDWGSSVRGLAVCAECATSTFTHGGEP